MLDDEARSVHCVAPFAAEDGLEARSAGSLLRPGPSKLGPNTRPNNPPNAIGEVVQTVLTSVSSGVASLVTSASIKSSMRRAATLASGPVLPTGPTHAGQPFSHSQSAI